MAGNITTPVYPIAFGSLHEVFEKRGRSTGLCPTDLFKSDHRVKEIQGGIFQILVIHGGKESLPYEDKRQAWENPRGANGAKYARCRRAARQTKPSAG